MRIGKCAFTDVSRSAKDITIIGKANGKSFLIKTTEDKIDYEND